MEKELEHYGVKGMKWRKHRRSKTTTGTTPVVSGDVNFPGGKVVVDNYNGKYNATVVYTDENGRPVSTGTFGDSAVPREVIGQTIKKLSTLKLSEKRFTEKGKKAIERVSKSQSKTKMSNLSSTKIKTGSDKVRNVLGKLKSVLPKKK